MAAAGGTPKGQQFAQGAQLVHQPVAEVLPHYAAQVLEDRRQEDQPHERIGGKEREQQHTGIAWTVLLLFGQVDVPIGMGVEQRPGIRRREIEPEIRPPRLPQGCPLQ